MIAFQSYIARTSFITSHSFWSCSLGGQLTSNYSLSCSHYFAVKTVTVIFQQVEYILQDDCGNAVGLTSLQWAVRCMYLTYSVSVAGQYDICTTEVILENCLTELAFCGLLFFLWLHHFLTLSTQGKTWE